MPRPQQLGSGLADLIALARNAVAEPQPRSEPGQRADERVRSEPAALNDLGTLGREFHQEKGRLDLTVEAFILQERWRPLFTDIERDIARRRLSEYGYDA